ncbi:MAG TPA: RNA-binding cell elongation regulator Jag/EloR [Syntrophales bacterium]|nr:RNA-binding cell elongation regulator Jag/EloR [Syntrophales bacterium]HRT26819.1 RNA-binding cell elongation regulator Jag/EloR [Syntrophales bacterium]HRT70219.1 RNA-binding cell elongation regulator Jag/EloR [Syntrophales bacterium]
MNALEVEGKNIDEAIQNACREFNVPREKLNIEILSEGSSGLLGLVGTKKARIRASLLTFEMGTEAAKETAEATPEKPSEKTTETGDTAEKAREILTGILSRMGMDFPVTVEETDEAVTLNIKGDGSGLLIGKGGQTLDAIQYILNKAVGKPGRDRRMIVLDTEDYRDRRDEYLVALAQKLGQKVKKSKKPITVNHLSARDRRVIHIALKDDEALTTKSRGEGMYRKIIILPKKKE